MGTSTTPSRDSRLMMVMDTKPHSHTHTGERDKDREEDEYYLLKSEVRSSGLVRRSVLKM